MSNTQNPQTPNQNPKSKDQYSNQGSTSAQGTKQNVSDASGKVGNNITKDEPTASRTGGMKGEAEDCGASSCGSNTSEKSSNS